MVSPTPLLFPLYILLLISNQLRLLMQVYCEHVDWPAVASLMCAEELVLCSRVGVSALVYPDPVSCYCHCVNFAFMHPVCDQTATGMHTAIFFRAIKAETQN